MMKKTLVHRFWTGRTMPWNYRRFGQRWEELHAPGEVQVIEWGAGAIELFPDLQPIFDDLKARDAGRNGVEYAVQVADVVGYALVERYGGVYVNCDMEPVRPFPALPERAWASYENDEDGRINNAAIGAPEPHDRFWRGLLEALPERYFSRRLDEMVMSTGPGFLTDYAADHPRQIDVLPMSWFNSKHWKTIRPGMDASDYVRRQDYPDDAIAVHHWGHKKDGRSNRVETATKGAA